ncbi:MAG: twin-arginine translocation signal domain-containing protein [Planctomycetes bacterium]|nr:twin-arginine translocation signal domain-containing protein [Planctomycetota bacterium]
MRRREFIGAAAGAVGASAGLPLPSPRGPATRRISILFLTAERGPERS